MLAAMNFLLKRSATIALLAATLSAAVSLDSARAANPFHPAPEARGGSRGHWMTDGMAATIRLALKFRYRVHLNGLQELRDSARPGQGTLFLPNHPGFIDPFILVSHLWPAFHPRPIIAEEALDLVPGLRALMVKANALVVPKIDAKDRGEAIRKARDTVESIQAEILAGLERGENFVVYPAGQIKREKREQLRNASMGFDLVQALREQARLRGGPRDEDPRIVLVQTNGLWGSSFTHAPTGDKPVIGDVIKNATQTIVKNGVFLIPKRDVAITMQVAPQALLELSQKSAFNRALEAFYNEGNIEQLHVPYEFGGLPSIVPAAD